MACHPWRSRTCLMETLWTEAETPSRSSSFCFPSCWFIPPKSTWTEETTRTTSSIWGKKKNVTERHWYLNSQIWASSFISLFVCCRYGFTKEVLSKYKVSFYHVDLLSFVLQIKTSQWSCIIWASSFYKYWSLWGFWGVREFMMVQRPTKETSDVTKT